MKQKYLQMCFALVMLMAGNATAKAFDLAAQEPLTLDLQVMEPRITFGAPAHVQLTAPSAAALQATASKYQLTWMRTNEGVKPYRFIDDLTFVGVPVFVAGIIAKSEKEAFRQNDGTSHVLLTSFKTHIDDYSQFFGPAMTLGLKIGGVEGRSDWGRMLTSAALSYGIMAGLVNGVKYTAKEMRPDGTTRNSWPSGHTATSFVGATILHKEYGLTRSPWYSVAGYGVATATGVMRVLNNRHWVSDVLSGAGIGIMSGELAYAFSDLLFKGKGLLRNDLPGTADLSKDPSFFSISMGVGFGTKNLDFDMNNFDLFDDFKLKFRTSTAVSAEGAYFFNPYIGVGGRLRVNSSPINGWDRIMTYAQSDVKEMFDVFEDDLDYQDFQGLVFNTPESHPEFTIESDHLTEFAIDLGPYFNIPLSRRFSLGSKLLVGRSIMQELNLKAHYAGNVKAYDIDDEDLSLVNTGLLYDSEWDYFTLSANNTMKYGTGVSLTYSYKNNFLWKIFMDYDYTRKSYTLEYDPAGFIKDALPQLYNEALSDPELLFEMLPQTQKITKNRHTWILGASFAVSF